MRRKLIVNGNLITRQWMTEHFARADGMVPFSEGNTCLNYLHELAHTEDVLAVISIQEEVNLEQELMLQQAANAKGLPFIRIAFEHNKCLLGPLVLPDTAGCVQCLENRMKNAHPNKKYWEIAYRSRRQVKQEKGKRLPWTQPFLENIFALLNAELTSLEQGSAELRLKEAVYVGYSDTLIGKTNRFLPDPLCTVCSTIPDDQAELARIGLKRVLKQHPRAYRQENPKLQLQKLREHFYDWRTGIFNHLYRDPISPLIPFAVAEMPLQNEQALETGIGRTTTYYVSEMVAMLEGIERYAGMHPRGKRTVVRGSYNQLKAQAIHPEQLTIHEPEQLQEPGFNYLPYHDDLEINWIWTYSWKRQEPVLIPEQLVYYRILATKQQRVNRFCYETSNGCALGGSLEEAIYYALLEVIERDAFLVSWYNKLPLPQLSLANVEDKNILLVKNRLEEMGYELYVFNMTMHTKIPAIWAMVVNPDEDAPVKCYNAAGAHPDPEKAIFSALVEVITSVPIYEKSMPKQREKAHALHQDGSLVQDMHDHVLLYSYPKAIERFSFLFEQEHVLDVKEAFSSWYETEPPIDFTQELQELMQAILAEAEDILIIDQTTPELAKIDVHAVKVIVQGMLTMSFGHQYRRINKTRVKRAPVIAGYRDTEISDADINRHPHPFP